MKSSRQNITIKISGNLHETGMRFSAMHEAYKAGLNGIAKYLEDGAVYIEVEGYTEHVERFKSWCLKIAKKYDNRKIEINPDKIKGYTEFNIID